MRHKSFAIAALALAAIPAAAHAASFDVETATRAWLDTLQGPARAKSDAYFEGGYWLILWDALYAMGVALILLFTRLSAGMRSLAESIMPWRWLQTLLYAAMFIIVTAALTFPIKIHPAQTLALAN